MREEEIRKLKQLDREAIWHPFTAMQGWMEDNPLIIERAEGCRLFDLEGRSYLDGVSSLWVNLHGHRRAEIDAAICSQLEQLAHSTLLGLGNVPAGRLAEKLLGLAPPNLKRVFYSDSGSTAVEIALKMAFQYWQQQGGEAKRKTKFLSLKNAYHGDTLGSVSVGGIDLYHRIFHPLLFHTLSVENFDLGRAERFFAEHRGEIAAVVVEPMIQAAAGMILQPPGFLRGLRQLCDRHDAFLICDEVATGFGRTGKMFAVEHEAVEPDFLCLAKGISGGYLPLAATLTTSRVFAGFCGAYGDFKAFFHGHSYTGNPLACAAALASLEIFEQDGVIEGLAPKIAALNRELARFAAHPQVREVRQLGLMAGVELRSQELKLGARICRAARRHGALLRPLGNVLVVLPPLAISESELQELCGALFMALEEITSI